MINQHRMKISLEYKVLFPDPSLKAGWGGRRNEASGAALIGCPEAIIRLASVASGQASGGLVTQQVFWLNKYFLLVLLGSVRLWNVGQTLNYMMFAKY